jgi:signal transduction histidine kinase
MDLTQFLALIPLAAAIAYAALLLFLLGWNASPGGHLRAFSGFLATSGLWSLAIYFAHSTPLTNLPVMLLASGTLLLALSSSVYLDWSRSRGWAFVAGAVLFLAFLLDLSPAAPVAIPVPLAFFAPTAGGLLALVLWFGLSLVILIRTWVDYRQTYFPWHANRLLHWSTFIAVAVAGEALVFNQQPWVQAGGHILRFFAVFSLVRAVTSHRLFDIRARLRQSLAFLAILLASAVPGAGVLLLTLLATTHLELDTVSTYVVLLGIIVLGFALYQPFRRLIDRFIYRYFFGRELQTSQVVRRYSQAIGRTLDVDQLSMVIIGTISEMLETTRGALLLVSEDDEGYTIEAVPAMGAVPRENQRLPADSPLLQPLAHGRLPLLQYDIDFNPLYAEISSTVRAWLEEMAMDIYVPVHSDDQLSGLIALGPKSSGLPYRSDELELVQLLADQTVIALKNARLFSELNQQHDRIRYLNTDLRRQNDRLEILDKVKSDFITIASHELRTPLTQVKGYADILQAMNEEANLTREQTREIAGHIIRASSRLESLLAAMLDASQLEVSGLHLMLMPIRLEAVIKAVVDSFADALQQRRILLETEGIEVLPSLRGDYRRLSQAFSNLIGNAIKYTPDHGTITIEGAVAHGEDGSEYVELVIADTGIGIDRQYQQLIFEKFFRIGDPELHSSGTTKFKGAGPGLGLHIARGVIEAHGGSIWVESEGEDEERLPGSRFHIILPLRPPWEDEAEPRVGAPVLEQAPWLIR